MDLATLPKVELHSHLDCCLSYDAVRRIDPAVSYEDYLRDFVAPDKCGSLAEYLETTVNHRALLQTGRALRIAVEDAFDQMAADGVVYGELRFAPLAQTEGDLSADEVVACVGEETVRQIERTGIDAALILCTLRHYDTQQSMATAQLVERHASSGPVAALDVAGDEARYSLEAHLPAFEYVLDAGLGVTVHAGEAAGPGSVWEVLETMSTRRIGHGVRSVEDGALVERLREQRVHLEVCPASNVQTNTVRNLAEHPLDRLRHQGVSVGISADTRGVTGVQLTREYELVRDTFGWTTAEFGKVNVDALEAAFAPADVKRRVAARLDAATHP